MSSRSIRSNSSLRLGSMVRSSVMASCAMRREVVSKEWEMRRVRTMTASNSSSRDAAHRDDRLSAFTRQLLEERASELVQIQRGTAESYNFV